VNKTTQGFGSNVKPLFFSQDGYLHFVKIILRFFFKLLYHQLAFTYDLVAAAVSLGRWKDWVTSILPFIEGRRVLEIGFGPGHLQRLLLSRGLLAIGIDESPQMARLAKHNLANQISSATQFVAERQSQSATLRKSEYTQINLTRGLAQHLPFRDHSFDTIVATFPAEYITESETLAEVRRCLSDGGRFIVLPVAMQIGRGILDRATALLFRVTHQSPVDPIEIVREKLREPFVKAGFEVNIQELQLKSSLLLVIVAIPRRFDILT
jgi:ubiquinone/menaquinone biosynthesis C-methylase UbiE